MIAVCFVCAGNICRSPTAEGIFRHLVAAAGLEDVIEVDSAGTSDWASGDPPDPRSTAEALRRGIELTGRSRQFTVYDFERFDYVLVSDAGRYEDLVALAPDPRSRAKIGFLLDHHGGAGERASIPDPYIGERGFEEVFDLCEAACRGLLDHLIEARQLEKAK